MALERPWSCMPRIARKHGQNGHSLVTLIHAQELQEGVLDVFQQLV